MVTRRPEPFSIQLPAAIVLTLITALGSVFGAYYALKGGVEAAQLDVARLEVRIAKLENDRDSLKNTYAQSHEDLALVVQQLKELNTRLGRIEDRQVNIIVPAVTDAAAQRRR